MYMYINIHTPICIYSKTSLSRPTTGATLNGPFREVVGIRVKISLWLIVWDRNKAIDIAKWSICGGGRLERFVLYRE